MFKLRLTTIFLGISAMLIVPGLFALTVLPLTDAQLAEKAEMIVVGRVLSAHYDLDTADKHPYTYIHVHVDEYIKGKNASRELTLKTLGGFSAKMTMQVPGAANFYRNEEVLLFLERRQDGSLFPVGLFLGKYSVYRDESTGRKVVIRREDGNGKYSAEPRETMIRDLQPDEKIFLDDFRQKVRQFVQR